MQPSVNPVLTMQEFGGVAKAEERQIDVWRIEFETPQGSWLDKESVPAAMSVSKKNEGSRLNASQTRL